ncbi:MAG: T9SS type A sorting domain-containing protein [Candidatus Marinimicrobia bacterium]|nr:T9SS type A sorting domain-containing protein [Candidatus Neomarinimicrobiota bacterium]MBL7010948.1 T9SS type A sorting domain-containing protein [Candidatus Neomarinimicrobiota bacterium]MBL7031281.1 T9SS type A sorting domain-containing protein [Candidatus Neomarinimicrobiota bacterium]
MLEYFEPKEVKGEGKISISWVIHGYRYIDILSPFESLGDYGESGGCQVNINCSPEGNNWQDEKKSVALILAGGTRWCTGSLINNTRLDGMPYLLTANHCLDMQDIGGTIYDAINNPDLSNWSFYWNYESPDCSDGIDFIPRSTSGATVMANKSYGNGSDFALLKLTENPKDITPEIQLYFNGWDQNNPGQGGVGIHHPVGDIKKIGTHNIIPATSDCILGSSSFWKINWQSTANGHSITESGSSGSPLYDSNHRVIGQLLGAFSCLNPNCSDPPNDIANYGKFSVSWDNGTDPRRRLKDWLDPDNTGVTQLDGLIPIRVTINGPGDLMEGNIGTWSADVVNVGNSSVNYAWDKKDDGSTLWYPLGSGQTQSVTMGFVSFTLRVTIHVGTYYIDATFYVYRMGSGSFFRQGIAEYRGGVPETFNLSQNHPNPYNPETTIQFDLPEASAISLTVYNLLGNQIFSWVSQIEEAGHKQVTWNGKDLHGYSVPSGIYIYKLIAKSQESSQVFTENRKMILLK